MFRYDGDGDAGDSGDDDDWQATLPDRFEATSDASRWGTIPPALWAGSDTELGWGTAADDVYRVRPSTGSALEHFDGVSWTVAHEGPVRDLDGAPNGTVWLATDAGLFHGRGTRFEPAPLPPGSEAVERVDALDDGGLLALAGRTAFAFEAGAWSVLYEAPSAARLSDAVGTSSRDVWIVQTRPSRPNEVTLFRGDASGLAPFAVDGDIGFAALATSDDGDVWLTTDGRLVRLRDGLALPTPVEPYSVGVWANASAVWLTTPSQAVLHAL